MVNNVKNILVCAIILFVGGCNIFSDHKGKLSRPSKASLKIEDEYITTLDGDAAALLQRYFTGNSRWDIRRGREQIYAIRREKIGDTYRSTLNGFYVSYKKREMVQTRVIVSFGKSYGLGRQRRNITEVKAQNGLKVKTIIEGSHGGSPGYTSYLIVVGNGVNIEVYEQAPEIKRVFTTSALISVFEEIRQVLEYKAAIATVGKVPIPELYPRKQPQEPIFQVKESKTPGLFDLKAWANPQDSGELYIKAFDTSTNERLSSENMRLRSLRLAAWSDDPGVLFFYDAEISVYEGDAVHEYEARFELWHRNPEGEEKKVLETLEIIKGGLVSQR